MTDHDPRDPDPADPADEPPAAGNANDDDGPRRGDRHDEDRRPPMPPERGVERR